jgi:hypothetical protein
MMLASVPDFYGQLSSYQLQLVVSVTIGRIIHS